MLDAQIDNLLMEKMRVLKIHVLSVLRRMIAAQGRKHWFQIYLTISILLLNLESVYRNQCRQIQRYKEPVSRTPNHHLVREVDQCRLQTKQQQSLLHTWDDAAQNLIAHFRAVCRGNIPLNMNWSKEDQDAAEMDGHSLECITQLRGIVQARGMTAYCKFHARADQV